MCFFPKIWRTYKIKGSFGKLIQNWETTHPATCCWCFWIAGHCRESTVNPWRVWLSQEMEDFRAFIGHHLWWRFSKRRDRLFFWRELNWTSGWAKEKSLVTPRCNLQMPWLKNWRCDGWCFPTRKILWKILRAASLSGVNVAASRTSGSPMAQKRLQDWSRVAAPELEKLTDAGRMVSLEKCCWLAKLKQSRHIKTYQDYIVDVSSCRLFWTEPFYFFFPFFFGGESKPPADEKPAKALNRYEKPAGFGVHLFMMETPSRSFAGAQ